MLPLRKVVVIKQGCRYMPAEGVTFPAHCLYNSGINFLNLKKIIMKKLFKNAAILLVLISFFAISCKKEKPAPPPPAGNFGFTAACTPKGTNNTTQVNGDTVKVTTETTIRIEPLLPDAWKKCKGKWTHTVEGAWTNPDYSAGMDKNTGVVNFIPKKKGIFTIKFTYTCPDGSSTSATITIIVT
jgi:hypothetical protein